MKVFLYDIETEYEFDDSKANDETDLETALDEFYNLSETDGSFFGIIDEFDNCIQFAYTESKKWLVEIPNPPTFENLQAYATYDECVILIEKVYKAGEITDEMLQG